MPEGLSRNTVKSVQLIGKSRKVIRIESGAGRIRMAKAYGRRCCCTARQVAESRWPQRPPRQRLACTCCRSPALSCAGPRTQRLALPYALHSRPHVNLRLPSSSCATSRRCATTPRARAAPRARHAVLLLFRSLDHKLQQQILQNRVFTRCWLGPYRA